MINPNTMSVRFAFVFLLLFNFGFSQNRLPLIPQPKSIQKSKGNFVLNKETVIQAGNKMFEAHYLQLAIKQQTGLDLKIIPVAESGNIIKLTVKIQETFTSQKGKYAIFISKNQIAINSEENSGLFYGIQTLLQLFPSDTKNEVQIPCIQINDKP